jgi:hypothetical protein
MHSERRLLIASRLLLAHAVVTAAAGVVLVLAPAAIPASVGIRVTGDAFLLCYFLAAAEFGFSWLSVWGARSGDATVVRGVMLTCVVFHVASALLEVLVLGQGASPKLWINVAARVVVILAFIRFMPAADESIFEDR